MRPKQWQILFLVFMLVIMIDQVFKNLIHVYSFSYSNNFIHIEKHYNPGFILGYFAELPSQLRVVTTSTLGAFLIVIFILLQYLFPLNSFLFQLGISFFVGGLTGNLIDRITDGQVLDFISISFNQLWHSPIFNFADLFQWGGFILSFWALVIHGKKIWPEQNQRRLNWIRPHFQLKYCFLLLGIGISISLVTMVFSYTYIRTSLIETIGANSLVLKKILIPFLMTFTVILVAFCVAIFTLGKIISHKIVGPIYAFEKFLVEYIDAIKNGKDLRKFQLRANDDFQELNEMAEQLRQEYLKRRHQL